MNPQQDVPLLEASHVTVEVPDDLRVRLESSLPARTVILRATLTKVDDAKNTREFDVHTSQVDWKMMEWRELYRKSGLNSVKKDLRALAIDRPTQHKITVYLRRKFQAPPPLNAKFIFYLFLDAKTCDALVGDLEERYRLILKQFGAWRANFWYWTQAIRSVVPIVSAWGKKVALKSVIGFVTWAVAKGLVGHDSWLAVLADLWRRIRS